MLFCTWLVLSLRPRLSKINHAAHQIGDQAWQCWHRFHPTAFWHITQCHAWLWKRKFRQNTSEHGSEHVGENNQIVLVHPTSKITLLWPKGPKWTCKEMIPHPNLLSKEIGSLMVPFKIWRTSLNHSLLKSSPLKSRLVAAFLFIRTLTVVFIPR